MRERFAVALLAIMAIGGGIRLGVLEAVFPPRLVGDEALYFDTALNLAAGRGHEASTSFGAPLRAGWPPAQSFLLALFLPGDPAGLEPGRALQRLLVVQVALGTLLVGLVGLLGRALFGATPGLVAAAGAALHPTLVAFSHMLFSETLFAGLLLGALWCVWQGREGPHPGWAVAAGLLLGLGGLTREVAGPIALACGAWWLWVAPREQRRRALACAVLLGAVAAAVVLPWTLRNWHTFGRIVPVSTAGWVNLHDGNQFGARGWLRPDVGSLREFRSAWLSIPDEMERADFAREQARAVIRSEQPTWILKKLVLTPLRFFAPDSFLFKKIDRGGYGEPSLGAVRAALGASLLFTLAMVGLAIPGLAASDRARRTLLLFPLVAVLAVHVVGNAHSRYRMPFEPLLLVYAAPVLLSREAWRRALSGRRLWGVVAAWAMFLGVAVPYFAPDAVSLWTRGEYVDHLRP